MPVFPAAPKCLRILAENALESAYKRKRLPGSAPKRGLRGLDDRAATDEARLAIAGEEQRAVEIDEIRPLRGDDGRSHGQRRSDHAAHHHAIALTARFSNKVKRFGEPARLVELDVH